MLLRAQLWTIALLIASACALGWLAIPGECVVHPAFTAPSLLRRSVLYTLIHPFEFDEVYFLTLVFRLAPVALVALAFAHWRRRFDKLRAVTAFTALILAALVALHPYRTFSDVQLIVIVAIWGIVVLVAYESKASPGSALLALISIQIGISEIYAGLGVDRGAPFWSLLTCLSIVFAYSVFHYTWKLRHTILGRFTEIRRINPAAEARRAALLDQRSREGGSVNP